MKAAAIVRAIGDAAQRWTHADFPPRVCTTARVAERTGYSLPVVEYALDRLFESITADALSATIADELGSLDILDGFEPRPGRTTAWAAPAGRVCIVSSRTTIGVALPAAIFAMCAKCDVLVKDREDALISGFFETLYEEHEYFPTHARAQPWRADNGDVPDLREFAAVVVFGRNETLERVRRTLAPDARFIGFGSRASAGYIAREALSDENAARTIARGAARDLVLYETEGCLSLHALFVEDRGSVPAGDFLKLLDDEVGRAEIEFPRGSTARQSVARVAQERALAGFRTASGGSNDRGEPSSFLPRVLNAIVVTSPEQALEYVRRHALPLEGFAIAGDRGDVTELALKAGAVRLSRFGELQHPPLGGNHGGRSRIGDFVRWIDKTF